MPFGTIRFVITHFVVVVVVVVDVVKILRKFHHHQKWNIYLYTFGRIIKVKDFTIYVY